MLVLEEKTKMEVMFWGVESQETEKVEEAMAASFSFITSAAPTSASMVAGENGDWRGRRSKKRGGEVLPTEGKGVYIYILK